MSEQLSVSIDADGGTNERANGAGKPKQRRARYVMDFHLVLAIEHRVAELREPALDKPAFGEAAPCQGAKGIVTA